MELYKINYIDEDFTSTAINIIELSNKKFVRCKFNWTDFTEVESFFKCVFDTCDFSNARLNGVNIKDCTFLSCKFKGASFFATKLDDCKMTGSDFVDADCALIQIDGGDWSYTNLRKLSFQKQNLCGIRFFGADLSGCHFNQCKMNDCEFDQAIVHETSFYKSDIRSSSIEQLNIFEISFKDALLDIEQCVVIAEYLTECKYKSTFKESDA